MLNWFAKLFLTLTAIAPVGFTYAWVAYMNGTGSVALSLVLFCLALALGCFQFLEYAKKHLERIEFQPKTIEAADRENIEFLLFYLMPLFTSEFHSLNWQIWIPALLIFVAIIGTGYCYHFNPLLGIFGWHFYKAETPEGVTYVLITRRQLRSAKNCLVVGQLTEYIVLDLDGDC